jgi:hypothetical protein
MRTSETNAVTEDIGDNLSAGERSEIARYKLQKRYQFSVGVGIYLSLLSLIILVLLVLISMPITLQQVLVAIAALLVLNALDTFRKGLEGLEEVPTSSPSILGDTYHIYNHSYGDINTQTTTYATYNKIQALASAGAGIEQILNHISQTHPITTEREKMQVAEETIAEIEHNPSLKAKIVTALKAGDRNTLAEFINHPLNQVVVATLEGWLVTGETKSS